MSFVVVDGEREVQDEDQEGQEVEVERNVDHAEELRDIQDALLEVDAGFEMVIPYPIWVFLCAFVHASTDFVVPETERLGFS